MKPTGGERSNPQAEARDGECVSHNIRELDSASLREVESGQAVGKAEACNQQRSGTYMHLLDSPG